MKLQEHPLLVFIAAAIFFAAFIVVIDDQPPTTEYIEPPVQISNNGAEEEAIAETTDQVPEPEDSMTETTPSDAEIILDCGNCWLAPVDKAHTLASSYAPAVEELGLSGGGSLVPDAAQALRELFADATSDGLSMYVRSAYRSYQTQVTTFNYWVELEEATGLSREEAEIAANRHSARPGQSEHQLGTTVDLLCTGADFDSTPCNEEVWQWLEDNAASYGFALSYPEDQESVTGYIFEPWHYRYIGPANARAFAAQTDTTLNNWLLARYAE